MRLRGDGAEITPASDGLVLYFRGGNGSRGQSSGWVAASIWAGKADIQILKARVYSENNANTSFGVRLETGDYAVDSKLGMPAKGFVLRVGDHAYAYGGGGGKTGHYGMMFFRIPNQEEAEAAAKALSTECLLRMPPGYKFMTRFVPAQTEFHSNEPVLIKMEIKNLDDRTFFFQRGGQQTGARGNKNGFRAMLIGLPKGGMVADTGDPMNHGGLLGLVKLEPGKVFDGTIDLKKWFALDQPGTYVIHGFYRLGFIRSDDSATGVPCRGICLWDDYASADFTVVVK